MKKLYVYCCIAFRIQSLCIFMVGDRLHNRCVAVWFEIALTIVVYLYGSRSPSQSPVSLWFEIAFTVVCVSVWFEIAFTIVVYQYGSR